MDNMAHRTSLQGSVVAAQTISARKNIIKKLVLWYVLLKNETILHIHTT